jgi:heme-degrading monooxygenase HmoA
MHILLWEYLVKPEGVGEFLDLYGSRGEWAALFRRGEGYLHTELLRDQADPSRFVTIDYWESEVAWDEWRTQADVEYQKLDERGAGLTSVEREIGRFDIPA